MKVACASCGVCNDLTPLDGTPHSFCKACCSLVQNMADYWTAHGKDDAWILDLISKRFDRSLFTGQGKVES